MAGFVTSELKTRFKTFCEDTYVEFEGVTDPKEKFLLAVYLGASIKELKALLKNGGDVNYGGDNNNNPPLRCAVENGDVLLTKFLLDAGAEIGAEGGEDEWCPAYEAVLFGNQELLTMLLEHGADINQKCGGETPLFLAVKSGNREMVDLILEQEGVDTAFSESHMDVLLSGDSDCRDCLDALVAAADQDGCSEMHVLRMLNRQQKKELVKAQAEVERLKAQVAESAAFAAASASMEGTTNPLPLPPAKRSRRALADPIEDADSDRATKRQKPVIADSAGRAPRYHDTTRLPPPRFGLDLAALTHSVEVGDLIYLAGGELRDYASNRVFKLELPAPPQEEKGAEANPVSESSSSVSPSSWEEVAPMPTGRLAAAAAIMGGRLYVAGGMDDFQVNELTTVEAYDPQTNTWTACASMKYPRQSHQLVALGGYLYAVGGSGPRVPPRGPRGVELEDKSKVSLSTMERYDPQADAWTPVANMAVARREFAAAALDGKLYVTGGMTGTYMHGRYMLQSSCECYDPQTNAWTPVAELPEPRYSHVMANLGNALVLKAGKGYGNTELDTQLRYDAKADAWVSHQQLQ
jgi:hypothetical protein